MRRLPPRAADAAQALPLASSWTSSPKVSTTARTAALQNIPASGTQFASLGNMVALCNQQARLLVVQSNG